jgi:cytochrome c biogenesis protein
MLSYTILINDLLGNLFLYDEQGQLVRECFIGQDINLNSTLRVNFSDLITTTGLQIKTDFGILLVYLSFFVLMISAYVSFISYSQIWQLKSASGLFVGGKSNRAVLYFQEELKRMVQNYK